MVTIRHGHAPRGNHSPEYRTWKAMIERCENPNHIGYKYYGARGIKVCKRWRNDFVAFLVDMGLKPSVKHTIDRIDTNGNYTPKNCRWSLPRQQRLNQRPYDESSRIIKAWKTRSRVSKNRVDMVGLKFGRLTVLSYSATVAKYTYWLCRCDCGTEKVIQGKAIRNGNTKSCGCLDREVARQRAIERNKLYAKDYAKARWNKWRSQIK